MNDALYRMSRKPAGSVSPTVTVRKASEIMMEQGVGALVVLDQDRLVGILSERDVVGRVVVRGLDPSQTLVSEIMTRKVLTAPQGMTENQAMELMLERRIRHLPVVDAKGNVVGMLSVRHLLRHRVEQLDRSASDLVAYFSADGSGG
jgi:CBS domain-containing protein